MTQLEYIEAMAAINQEQRDNRRAHETQMSILEIKHRENVQEEDDRYRNAKRRQEAEYNTKVDDIYFRMTEIKKQRAKSYAEEQKNGQN